MDVFGGEGGSELGGLTDLSRRNYKRKLKKKFLGISLVGAGVAGSAMQQVTVAIEQDSINHQSLVVN